MLLRIYPRDAYYERARLCLSRRRPKQQQRLSCCGVRAFFSSTMHYGLLEKARLSYGKLVLTAAALWSHSFGIAMALAVMGHHFQMLTGQLSETAA